MKTRLILALMLLACLPASGTVTLSFNSAGGSLTNFANGSGVGGTPMVWGILVDTAGNGFSYVGSQYDSQGVSYSPSTPQNLSLLGGAATDDVLFLSPNLMNIIGAAGADGAPQGTNRVTTIASVPFGPSGINAGDAFAVVWFNSTTAPAGAAIPGGTSFGAFNHAGFLIPADGATISFADLFTGPDALKTQAFTIGVPEPASVLLGLLGAFGLLRRRRQAGMS